MDAYWNLGGGWLARALALTPTQKWRAARFKGSSVSPWWTSNLVIISGLVLVVGLLVCLVLLRRRRRRRAWADLESQARARGVNDREFLVLAEVSRRAKLKQLPTVLSLEAVFDRGAAAYLQSGRFARLSPESKNEHLELVESLRAKMDFAHPSSFSPPGVRTTRGLPEGTPLTVFRDERNESFQAVLTSANAVGMAIEPEQLVSCKPREVLRVQFSEGEQVMQFQSRAVRSRNGKIILDHTGKVHPADRRRFKRVAAHMSARAAVFPFEQARAASPGEFRDAEVLEIAGPALKVAWALPVRPNTRVRLEVDLPSGQVIQSAAVVRRFVNRAGGKNVCAVELLGLGPEEVDLLIREADALARRDAPAKAQAPQGAPGVPAPQKA